MRVCIQQVYLFVVGAEVSFSLRRVNNNSALALAKSGTLKLIGSERTRAKRILYFVQTLSLCDKCKVFSFGELPLLGAFGDSLLAFGQLLTWIGRSHWLVERPSKRASD